MDHQSVRDQTPAMSSSSSRAAARQRSKFTADVIRAIEDLEIRRTSRSSQQLADAAWQKLQFDLPVVLVAELQALLEHLRASLQGKTSWPCYSLTARALENISSGAKRSSSFSPVQPEQDQQLLQLLEEVLSSSIKAKAAGVSNSSGTGTANTKQGGAGSQQQCAAVQQNQQQQQDRQLPQQLYQQLCAVLLLQYVAKAVSLPELEAWQLLADYHPEQPELDQQQQQPPPAALQDLHDLQQQPTEAQLDDAALLAALAAASGGSGTAVPSAQQAPAAAAAGADGNDGAGTTHTACTSIYELQDAAVQDEDGEEYEALEPMHSPAVNNSRPQWASTATGQQQQQQQQEQYSWPALRHKLCSLAGHVHYNLFDCELLWREQAAAQHLLQLLRALGVHARAEQLQPVLHAYVGLLVDRLAAAPADLPLLQQLWEALGLTGGQGLGLRAGSSSSSSSSSRQQALPSEAVLGLSVAASVWAQLAGASARAQLWRLMHGNLLPLLEQCSEQLSYNAAAYSAAAGSIARQQQAAVQGEGLAHALLLCHVVELLLLGRPGVVDVAGQLVQRGVMRSLVALYVQHAGNAAAEPVRRAVLLASCSSQQAAGWVLAVPAVLQQLQQPSFQLGGAAEAHGALWELLISKNSSSCTSGAAHSSAAQCGQLLELLGLDSSSVGHLQRQVALLQLLADAQQAAGSRRQLWGEEVVAALKRMAASIKALQAGSAAAAAAMHSQGQQHGAAASTGSNLTAGETAADRTAEADKGEANGAVAAGATAGPDGGGSGSSDSEDGDDDAEGKGAKAAQRLPQQQQQQQSAAAGKGDAVALGRRRQQQLQPAALKFIKQLLASGGKTD